MLDNDDIQRDGRDEQGRPNGPERRTDNGQPCSTLAETARRCPAKPDALAIDADVIRMTPTPVENLVLRRSVVTTESETPESAPPAQLTSPREAARRRDEHQEAATTPKEK